MDELKQNIYGAMSRVMAKVGAIGKDQSNKQQGFKFRGIDDVYNALHTPMAEEGIFCVPEVLESSRSERPSKQGGVLAFVSVKVKFVFYASDGSNVSCVMVGEGMDSGDKATSKAVSIAMKYAMLETFCIPTSDEKDPDLETVEPAPAVPSTNTKLNNFYNPPAKPTASTGAKEAFQAVCKTLSKRDLANFPLQDGDFSNIGRQAMTASGIKNATEITAWLAAEGKLIQTTLDDGTVSITVLKKEANG